MEHAYQVSCVMLEGVVVAALVKLQRLPEVGLSLDPGRRWHTMLEPVSEAPVSITRAFWRASEGYCS